MIGWREWISLPDLGMTQIKAKIDTGARTSALHAFSIKPFKDGTKDRIRFDMHPYQKDNERIITCEADVVDLRWISDSGGHLEERYIINTPITLGGMTWPIEVSLTERDTMLFRMLLGRRALRKRFIINPGRSFITTKKV